MISQPDKLRIVGLWNSTELQAIVYTKVIKQFYIFINAIKYTFTPIYIQGKNMTEIYFKSLRSGSVSDCLKVWRIILMLVKVNFWSWRTLVRNVGTDIGKLFEKNDRSVLVNKSFFYIWRWHIFSLWKLARVD